MTALGEIDRPSEEELSPLVDLCGMRQHVEQIGEFEMTEPCLSRLAQRRLEGALCSCRLRAHESGALDLSLLVRLDIDIGVEETKPEPLVDGLVSAQDGETQIGVQPHHATENGILRLCREIAHESR